MKETHSRNQAIGWTGSVLLHGAVFIAVALYAYFYSFSIQGDVRVTATSEAMPTGVREMVEDGAEARIGGILGGTDRALAERISTRQGVKSAIEDARARAQQMPPEEQLALVNQQSDRLEKIKPADMTQMAAYVESAFGLPPATQPDPSQEASKSERTFDHDTSRPTDIIPAVGPKKEPGYLWTLTDAQGLTKSFFVPTANMSPEDVRMADLFEKARQSPNFSVLLNTAVKLAARQAHEKTATQPAGK